MRILWDFDGTLFNTYPSYAKVMGDVIEHPVSEEEMMKYMKVSMSHAISHFQLNEDQVNEFVKRETGLSPKTKPPFVGVENVLKKSELNVIMTHKPRKELEEILGYYEFTKYFEEWIAGDDGYPRKPDPASYRYLHKKYHINLAIGDRAIDIIPARKLGMKTCLFQNKQSGADFYLDDYREFFEIVHI